MADRVQDGFSDNTFVESRDIEDKETLFFFYGKSLNATQADEIANHIREKYPNLEVGAYEGKQDVYDLLVGIN